VELENRDNHRAGLLEITSKNAALKRDASSAAYWVIVTTELPLMRNVFSDETGSREGTVQVWPQRLDWFGIVSKVQEWNTTLDFVVVLVPTWNQ
jgi:hypothetical protein